MPNSSGEEAKKKALQGPLLEDLHDGQAVDLLGAPKDLGGLYPGPLQEIVLVLGLPRSSVLSMVLEPIMGTRKRSSILE